jgi:hypothetical protein
LLDARFIKEVYHPVLLVNHVLIPKRIKIGGCVLIIQILIRHAVIPHSEKEGTKPPYMCPGCSNHTHGNNMINRCNVINKRVIFLI